MKTLKITTVIQNFLFAFFFVTVMVNAQESDTETFLKPKQTTTYQSISSDEQMLWYVNAQNLINTWNNIIIDAKTGKEQLQKMDKSNVFAKDVKLTFNFNGELMNFTGLTDEPLPFYTGFVDPLKKKRTNIASNFEVVEFGENHLLLNFKHFIFFNETLSLVGQNQIKVERDTQGKYLISKAYIDVRLANVEHGY